MGGPGHSGRPLMRKPLGDRMRKPTCLVSLTMLMCGCVEPEPRDDALERAILMPLFTTLTDSITGVAGHPAVLKNATALYYRDHKEWPTEANLLDPYIIGSAPYTAVEFEPQAGGTLKVTWRTQHGSGTFELVPPIDESQSVVDNSGT